ncbi:MAG: pyridoxal phosphate-dependent decarboxylase family protein, partial [Methyloligellaceae bacterium]
MSERTRQNPTLELTPEEMRSLGYRAVDLLVDHIATLPEQSPVALASRKEMDDLLMEPPPEQGTDAADVLGDVIEKVFPNCDRLTHPRFFAFVPSPSNFVSVIGDFLATGFNVFAGGWIASPAAAEIEIVTINWLLELFGMPLKEGGGIYTSGGSMANLIGLATARKMKLQDRTDGATLYLSDQAHSSNHRAAKVLGYDEDQIRLVPTDDAFRMDVGALAAMVARDQHDGRRPFCVIATAGTTNTGAVDPLEDIAELCAAEELWMHVDGAYGGAAILTQPGREALRGIERAHSVTVDPHKWLFQPYEIGCILVREHAWLRATFSQQPEYLRDTQGSSEEINFYDHGVQLTRRFRALKFYMSIKAFGLASFREAVQFGIAAAETTQAYLERRPDWEIMSPATLGVINFRFRP